VTQFRAEMTTAQANHSGGSESLFLRCPPDATCDYCAGRKPRPALSGALDGIYCINIQEQPKRFVDITTLFHREGMCGDVTFYRPRRGPFSTLAIWTSHREVAREALRRGQTKILVLEDDLNFLRPWSSILASVDQAEARLPAGWFALYVGHSPLQGYFAGPGIMRVSSATTHAFVANKPLLDWLDTTPPMDPYVPVRSRMIGFGVDGAFARLPGMFALFPMKILQRRVEEVRSYEARPNWLLHQYRLFSLVEGAWFRQWIAAALSPLHWLVMQLPNKRSPLPAEVQAEARRLFDAGYYAHYPDLAAQGRATLEHFIRFGSNEYRNPNAWFITHWYVHKYPDARRSRLTAFEHYLWRGRSLGYRPNDREQTADVEQRPSPLASSKM
jgi:hypothetical protein